MNEHIFVFLPQPVKRGQEISVLIEGIYFDSLALLFWFDFFLEARAEILAKPFVGILV